MGELQAFGDGLAPEARALAQALRDLFAGLGISERRYAARRSYDSSTISRYLSGQRIPPWEFVLNLLNDVAEERGTVPTLETTRMMRDRHMAALKAGKSPSHKVQLLEQQLALADQEARRVSARERVLEDALQDREHRIRDLQMQFRQLQAMSAPVPGDEGPADDGTDDERARLRTEIRQLTEELERTRELHRQAETRCEQLERQLAEAESRPDRPDAPVAVGAGQAGVGLGAMLAPGAIFHSDVKVNITGWQSDETFVDSVTVQVVGEGAVGNGLLVDPTTVVTSWWAIWRPREPKPGTVEVLDFSRRVGIPARVVQWLPAVYDASASLEPFPTLAVLRLESPWGSPVPAVGLGGPPPPGTQLIISGRGRAGRGDWEPYSCLLEVKGRSGEVFRLEGEFTPGLRGAPAFHTGTGELAGLVSGYREQKGALIPADALRQLTTLGYGPTP
ncbi:hypothetical protein [Streptomyces griseocarneus]|uniref:hypothetical protein n=1 Tax=Streptomyces griseocarneus TaxID=51201 RepID=UPI00167D0F9A|nr:hypothetical protein [Streptomyces griseocarneus]MBZ6477351.1 hypothetical protein [Streptomyces griseocarneus]GHG76029.1 hypothetical protein GCM10018779_53970 [Streptomyces griseocarneus]